MGNISKNLDQAMSKKKKKKKKNNSRRRRGKHKENTHTQFFGPITGPNRAFGRNFR